MSREHILSLSYGRSICWGEVHSVHFRSNCAQPLLPPGCQHSASTELLGTAASLCSAMPLGSGSAASQRPAMEEIINSLKDLGGGGQIVFCKWSHVWSLFPYQTPPQRGLGKKSFNTASLQPGIKIVMHVTLWSLHSRALLPWNSGNVPISAHLELLGVRESMAKNYTKLGAEKCKLIIPQMFWVFTSYELT